MNKDKYCTEISQIKLSDEKKAEIKNALRSAQKKQKETSVTVVSAKAVKARRIKLVSAIAATLVLVIGVSWFLSSVINVFKVNDPISYDDYLYMADVAGNAQYLPNEKILAASDRANALNNSLEEESEYDDYYQEVYKTEKGQLDFSLEDYRTLNDSLAIISNSSTTSDMTIYDIKKEIEFAIEIVPGYDQWFRLSNSLPYLSESDERNYNYYSYKISNDKDAEKLTVERLCWRTRGESYDISNDKFYSDAYQRQYFKVEYYFDEEEREVVDCTVINYLCVKKNVYYPVSAQKLINVKDHSLTKYAATYLRQSDVVDPLKFENNDDLYDLTNMYDYGINTIMIQLNYNSSDDISLLKAYYETADKHYGRATTGELSYYRKTAEDTLYFTDGWDNRIKNDVEPMFVYNHARVYDSVSETHKNIVKSFSNVRNIRYNMLCEVCEKYKPSADGVFIDCSHGVRLSSINRTQNQIFSDNSAILSDSEYLISGISEQFATFTRNLELDTEFILSDNEKYVFESSVNDYVVRLGKDYYYNKVQTDGYGELDSYVDKTSAVMTEENIAEYMKDKYFFTYDVDDKDSVMKDLDITYSVSAKVNIINVDPGAEYYLAVIFENYNDSSDFSVLSKTPLNMTEGERTVVKGNVTVDFLIKETLRLSPDFDYDTEYKLAYAVLKVSDNSITKVTYSRVIDVDYSDSLDKINNTMYYNGIPYIVSPCDGGISIRIWY